MGEPHFVHLVVLEPGVADHAHLAEALLLIAWDPWSSGEKITRKSRFPGCGGVPKP
jgi:hypothetical protein